MENITKICIGIPTFGLIKSRTALALMNTINENKDLDFFPLFCHSGYIAENFNKIVRTAQDMLCSHIFFVEHDMIFPPSTIKKLLAHDKDVVGTLYHCRYLPLTLVNYFFDENKKMVKEIPKIPDELFEAPIAPTGCLLVKTEVFEKTGRPYFPMEQEEDGTRSPTQDIGFCEKVRAAGMQVWIDPTIPVGHIGDFVYGDDFTKLTPN